ncbi:uncharacterized protein TNCV_4021391 [Trichonephila clavipes]|nr:uncharacterized protein TNCV_4021391 [Trichonephila clavipes]
MAGYEDLSEFVCERAVIVGAREMGRIISEVAMKFRFSRTTISRVYRQYRESGKTSNLRHRFGRKKNTQERDQRRLKRIIPRDRCATHPKIAANFIMLGHQQVLPCEPFNKTSLIWAFRAKGPFAYPC